MPRFETVARLWHAADQPRLFRALLRWLVLATIAGVLAGTASAILLVSLNWATATRESHRWIILLLPLCGLLIGLVYKRFGSGVEGGNNLILQEVHDPKATLPLRMTPLILLGTVLTHLFGGSAGREGTAVQMGASLADQITRLFGFGTRYRRILLMAGLSAGFASVFGTPLAGAIFGIEVLAIGSIGYDAIFPCFVSAFVGDYVTQTWGAHHTVYRVTEVVPLTPLRFLAAIAAGVIFGLTAMLFARTTHAISQAFKRHVAWSPARPMIGGVVVAAAVFATGTTRYIGLGIPTIVEAFATRVHWYDFAAKFAFTTVTLGSGFKGGEVTPLFFIGATLGNALSHVLPLPSSLLAGMGFAAVFAGAANTPISSTLLAVELFGADAGPYAAIACVVSYLFSGHSGIYHAQRVGTSKHSAMDHEQGMTLASVAEGRAVAQQPAPEELRNLNQAEAMKEEVMESVTVVRLYFTASDMMRPDSWWQRMAPQSLGAYLLREAKAAGIEQALLHRVIGGYLKDHALTMLHGEILPDKLPQCLELVGDEEVLQAFLARNREHLAPARIIFLRGEQARIEAEVDQQEIEVALEMEEANAVDEQQSS